MFLSLNLALHLVGEELSNALHFLITQSPVPCHNLADFVVRLLIAMRARPNANFSSSPVDPAVMTTVR